MDLKKISKISISLAIFLLLISINFAFALEYKYPWSEAKTPADLVRQFYLIALGLAGGAAMAVILYGAILYTLSEAIAKKEDAKEYIKGAIYGLILLLSAYLILWTINPDLVNLRNPGLEPIKPKLTSPISTFGEMEYLYESLGPAARLSGDDTKKLIEIRGAQVKPGVILDNMRATTIDEVRYLAGEYFSFAQGQGYEPLVVTAGTECSGVHKSSDTSHCAGYKVDLRAIPRLDQFIKETNFFKYIGDRSDGAPMYVPFWDKNTIYAREGDHWDVRTTRDTLLDRNQ